MTLKMKSSSFLAAQGQINLSFMYTKPSLKHDGKPLFCASTFTFSLLMLYNTFTHHTQDISDAMLVTFSATRIRLSHLPCVLENHSFQSFWQHPKPFENQKLHSEARVIDNLF